MSPGREGKDHSSDAKGRVAYLPVGFPGAMPSNMRGLRVT
jgi:hypothetical protein